VKFKGVDRIALVTDAITCAGLPDGSEMLFENPNFIIEDGVAKLPDRSAFAGSVCTTNRLVRNMIELADVSLLDAVAMASANPARMANLRDRGHIREGNFADTLIFDENIDISLTMVNGKVVFAKQ
jgi:N-acetylglucosamine-6-phosphate deacetylase